MRLQDIESVSRALALSPLANDLFWRHDIGAVTEMDIQLFYARAGLMGHRKIALDLIDRTQSALIMASFDGVISQPSAAIILHEFPPEPFLVDELVDGLVKLKPSRRQACLFALESNSTPQAAADLLWSAARRLNQLTPLCLEILAAAGRTRHLHLPYVFWEWATPNIATPLLELQWSVEKAFDCSWPELARRYRTILQLNRGAEAASFLELAQR